MDLATQFTAAESRKIEAIVKLFKLGKKDSADKPGESFALQCEIFTSQIAMDEAIIGGEFYVGGRDRGMIFGTYEKYDPNEHDIALRHNEVFPNPGDTVYIGSSGLTRMKNGIEVAVLDPVYKLPQAMPPADRRDEIVIA